MKIAKPLLLVTTPIGLALGLYEGWRLAGGLVFLMAAMIGVVGVAALSIVRTIRREREAEKQMTAHDSSRHPRDRKGIPRDVGGDPSDS